MRQESNQESSLESTVPLYDQVARQLQHEIEEQKLATHSKIPSEVDLAERYRVSRGTVTKALNALVQRGVLYRRRPQGTFVAPVAVASPREHEVAAFPVHTVQERPAKYTSELAETGVVGLVMPYLSDSFLGGIVIGIETLTRTLGYSLNFACSDNDWTLERYHLEQAVQRGVAGVLLFPAEQQGQQKESLQFLQQHNVPFVLIDRYLADFPCDYVVSDDVSAGYMATQHLVTLGHQRIGFVSVAAQLTSSTNRYQGYVQCLQQYGLPVDEHLCIHALRQTTPASMPGGVPSPDSGQLDRSLLRAYLQQPDRPDALVVLNDYVALRILQVAEELELDVPRQLALVSCGGSAMGPHARVPLTSVMQSPNEIGRQAAHILHDRITRPFSGSRHVSVPVSLAIRRSCGAIQSKIAATNSTYF